MGGFPVEVRVSDPTDIVSGQEARGLVIEDVPEDRERVEAMLTARGLDPVVVATLEEAQAAAAGQAPAAIVLSADVRNGFNLCLRFRKDPILKDAPLVMTTAKAGPDIIEKHRRLPTHADEYVRKPLDEESLGNALDRLLGSPVPVLELALEEETPPDLPGTEPAVAEAPPEPPSPPDEVPPEPAPVESGVAVSAESPPPGADPDLAARIASLEAALEARDAQEARLAAELEAAQDQVAALTGQLDAARASAEELGPLKARLVAIEEERDALAGQMDTLRSFEAEIEPLRVRIAALEEERDTLLAAEEKARTDLEQTTQFFERLEAGYKDSLAAAQAEKVATEEARERCEERIHELTDKADELARLQATLPPLHEAAARAELLAKDIERLRPEAEEAETLRNRLAALETVNQELETRIAELDAANQAQAAQIGEMVRMKRDFAGLRRSEAEARAHAEALAAHLERIRRAVLEEAAPPDPDAPPKEAAAPAVMVSRDDATTEEEPAATQEDPA